jgi:hypothetical protein
MRDDDNGYLYSPLDDPLYAGLTVDFKIMMPGYKQVSVVINEEWFPLEDKGSGVFSGSVDVPKTRKLGIFGSKKTGFGSFTGLVGYTVESH